MMEASTQAPPAAGRTRIVEQGGASLHVVERGDATAPTIVFVHGYPDSHRCWDEVLDLLEDRFHVVAYDIRGVGRSTAPDRRDAYALEHLARDLGAVIDAVSPGESAHVVGHDWGAFTIWEAVTTDGIRDRIASFTAVAGPRIDRARGWALQRLRPSPRSLAELAGQARRSWYMAAVQLPWLPERVLAAGGIGVWRHAMRRLEGIEPRDGHPADTFVSDAQAGLGLYRSNVRGLSERRADRGPATVPVQVIVATDDPFESAVLFDDAHTWATRVWRRDIRSGHWLQRSHPEQVARSVSELVEHAEGAPEGPALRRARYAGGKPDPIRGRLAVVTGAGSGIGRATALALAGEGAEVICADIDLESAKDTVMRAPDDAYMHAARLDVGDAQAMEEFAEMVAREHGVPAIVVNNAGIGIGGPFLDTTLADWERIVDVNMWGVIHGSRLFAAQMVAAGVQGQIVNVSSAAGYTPSRILPAYSTTKAAVLMLSECMRAELADAGIGVTAICPGIVNTNITRTTHMVGVSAEEERAMQERGAKAYARRNYPPEKVAAAIVKAIRRDSAVVPVTPEAKLMLAMSRLTPGVVRRLARLNPGG